ncbi:unnamed protein product [Peniophora sp. CBMAI 1063]|nr:unnamed protein product [Peniophora sp. CBMAI 1063]
MTDRPSGAVSSNKAQSHTTFVWDGFFAANYVSARQAIERKCTMIYTAEVREVDDVNRPQMMSGISDKMFVPSYKVAQCRIVRPDHIESYSCAYNDMLLPSARELEAVALTGRQER